MTHRANIEEFIRQWQKTLNKRQFVRSCCTAALLTAMGAAGVSLGYVIAGYRVAVMQLLWAVGAGAAFLAIHYLCLRNSHDRAAEDADDVFGLKDGLTSAMTFARAGKERGIYALQHDHTSRNVEQIDTSRAGFRGPWVRGILAALLLGISAWLCTLEESEEVKAEKAEAAVVEQKTTEIKEYVRDLIEETIKNLSEKEKALLDKSAVAKMFEKLKVTKDRKEALRQYAQLEKEIRRISVRMSTKQDERFAQKMAEELSKDEKTKELAKDLATKNYDQAAEGLKDFLQEETDDIEQSQEDFQTVCDASDRMCTASENMGECDSCLKEQADQFCEQAQCMAGALCEAGDQFCELGQCSEGCMCELSEERVELNEELCMLCDCLEDLDARRGFLAELDELRDCLGFCQSYMQSSSRKLVRKRGIGSASHGKMDNEKTIDTGEGLYTQLKGQKGQGPSQVSVQETSSGTGVQRLADRTQEVSFRRQMESLVRREDVPEDLKDGVKTYFETIHEVPAE